MTLASDLKFPPSAIVVEFVIQTLDAWSSIKRADSELQPTELQLEGKSL